MCTPESNVQEQQANALLPLDTSMIDVVGCVSGVAVARLLRYGLLVKETEAV